MTFLLSACKSPKKNDIELHIASVYNIKSLAWWCIKEILSNFGNLLSLFSLATDIDSRKKNALVVSFSFIFFERTPKSARNDTLFAHLSLPIKI